MRSLSFPKDVLTIGTAVGAILFYDLRAGKYMESTMNRYGEQVAMENRELVLLIKNRRSEGIKYRDAKGCYGQIWF